MLFDICNCLTILLLILITFPGFMLPGCKGSKSGNNAKKTGNNLSQKKVSRKSKKSNSSIKKSKPPSKKQNKSKRSSRKSQMSKTQTDTNNNSTVTKPKEEEGGDKPITKTPSKGPEAPAGGSDQVFVTMELYNEANDTSKVDTTLTDIKPSAEEVIFENGKTGTTLTLHNVSDVRRAFKLKCSDVNKCKVKPSAWYLAPDEKKTVEFSLTTPGIEAVKLFVLYTIANLDGNDPGKEFKADEKFATINLKIVST